MSSARRRAAPYGVDRSTICDAGGRHIPVVEKVLVDDKALKSVVVGRPRTADELVAKLDGLSGRVRRLAPPSAHEPTRFHEERSEIARELQRLAEWVKGNG